MNENPKHSCDGRDSGSAWLQQGLLENCNKLTVGMRYEAVTQFRDSPERCDDMMGVRACQCGDEKRSTPVNFVGGKVLPFSSSNL